MTPMTARLPRAYIISALLIIILAVTIQPVLAALTHTEAKLTASDGEPGDLFGRVSNSLALSGNTAIVGAYTSDDVGESSGSAYVFQNGGTGWTEQAKLTASDAADGDLFGQAVALDGDIALIGSFFDDDNGSHSGSAYVFTRTNDLWSETAKLTASDGLEADQFGQSVALEGAVAVIGAPWDDGVGLDSGSAYVFRWNGAAWVEEAKLTASDGAASDLFGESVAISGNTIAVGAWWNDGTAADTGAVYIYRWNGSAWVEEVKLTASDASKEDYFGFSVSISGDSVLAGAHGKGPGPNKGAAYVFRFNGSSWSQEAKLTASDGSVKDAFGVSASLDGNLAVIGASQGDDGEKNTGAAYIFQRAGAVWTEELKLFASDAATKDLFGESVSINGNIVVVGAPRDDDKGLTSGSAYVYELISP